MKQSIWCNVHERWHDVIETSYVVRQQADHLHIIETFVTTAQEEILECAVCGEQWGAP